MKRGPSWVSQRGGPFSGASWLALIIEIQLPTNHKSLLPNHWSSRLTFKVTQQVIFYFEFYLFVGCSVPVHALCDCTNTTLFFQWGHWPCWINYSGFVLTPFHSTPILTSSPVSEPLSYLTLARLSLLLRLSPSVSFRISTTRVWWMGSMPWWE